MADKKKNIPADDMSAEDIMRQYDRESATRIWAGIPRRVVRYIMAAFSLYCIWSTLFSTADLPIRLSAFLGLIVIMGYLTYPASKHHVKPNCLPWYDIVLMAAGAFCFFFFCFRYNSLVMVITSAGKINPWGENALPNAWFYLMIGIVGVLVLAELCRRCVGLPILIVAGALLAYTFASGQNLARVVYTLFYGTSGVMATPVQVCLKFIVRVRDLRRVPGAHRHRRTFFIDAGQLASPAGRPPAVAAKVAVISSALCGMVSGLVGRQRR